MLLIARFEPGDMTSYIVVCQRLTAKEANEVGGFDVNDGPLLFGFAPRSGPWDVYVFSSNPDRHGQLEFGYYASKITHPGHDWGIWTTVAGAIVLSALTGRELYGAPEDIRAGIKREWRSDWFAHLLEHLVPLETSEAVPS